MKSLNITAIILIALALLLGQFVAESFGADPGKLVITEEDHQLIDEMIATQRAGLSTVPAASRPAVARILKDLLGLKARLESKSAPTTDDRKLVDELIHEFEKSLSSGTPTAANLERYEKLVLLKARLKDYFSARTTSSYVVGDKETEVEVAGFILPLPNGQPGVYNKVRLQNASPRDIRLAQQNSMAAFNKVVGLYPGGVHAYAPDPEIVELKAMVRDLQLGSQRIESRVTPVVIPAPPAYAAPLFPIPSFPPRSFHYRYQWWLQ